MTQQGPPLMEPGQANGNGVDHNPTTVHHVGDYELVRLTGTDEFSRAVFPKFVERAMGFIDRTRCDTDPIWLGRLLYAAMAENIPQVLMLAVISPDDRLVAHAIAYPEPYQRLGVVANLLQVEKDKDVPHEVLELGNTIIDDWARSQGYKDIINSTATMAHVRTFENYGYKLHRYLTRKNLREVMDSGEGNHE